MAERAADGTAVNPNLPVVTERTIIREIKPDPPLGPNATSTAPEDHFFLAADGKTHINAWGEEIGSDADKKRKASL